ncbi:general substrate transporter [Dipodascopsis uninucleata]
MAGAIIINTGPPVKQRSIVKVALENPYVLCVTIFSSLGGLLFGYDQGVVSGVVTMESFAVKFPKIYLDSDFKGWFVSTFLLAAWFGSLLNGQFTDRLGRKRSMMLSVVIFVVGSSLQAAGINLAMIFCGRAIAGVSVGMLTMVVPLYMAEIAPAEIRGGLVVLQQLSITAGILISYWIDYAANYIGSTRCWPNTPYRNGISFNPYTDVGDGPCRQSSAAWRLPLGLQLLPAIVLGIGMISMPYSPRWLVMQDRSEEALSELSRIRRKPADHPDVEKEFIQIKAEVVFDLLSREERFGQKRGIALEALQYIDIVRNPSSRKRVFIGSAVMFFQQFIGCNAIIYYAPTIFGQLGLNSNTVSLLATGVYGIVNFLATLPAFFLIDRIGRRVLLMAGAIGTCISLIVVAAIIQHYGGELSAHPLAGWIGIVFIYLYDIHFSYSWAPVGWVLPSEIFPIAIRAKSISITTSSTWMNNFIIGLISPRMLEKMTYGTYIFFAAFAVIGFFFTLFMIPETRGRSLEEMDEVFNDTTSIDDKRRLQQISNDLEQASANNQHPSPFNEPAYDRMDFDKPGNEDSVVELVDQVERGVSSNGETRSISSSTANADIERA